MRRQTFALLFLAWACGTITVYFEHATDVLEYRETQRRVAFRATLHRWRQIAGDERALQNLREELDMLRRETAELHEHESRQLEQLERILERWLIARGVWRPA